MIARHQGGIYHRLYSQRKWGGRAIQSNDSSDGPGDVAMGTTLTEILGGSCMHSELSKELGARGASQGEITKRAMEWKKTRGQPH